MIAWTPALLIALIMACCAFLGLTVILVAKAVIPVYFQNKFNMLASIAKICGEAMNQVVAAKQPKQ